MYNHLYLASGTVGQSKSGFEYEFWTVALNTTPGQTKTSWYIKGMLKIELSNWRFKPKSAYLDTGFCRLFRTFKYYLQNPIENRTSIYKQACFINAGVDFDADTLFYWQRPVIWQSVTQYQQTMWQMPNTAIFFWKNFKKSSQRQCKIITIVGNNWISFIMLHCCLQIVLDWF